MKKRFLKILTLTSILTLSGIVLFSCGENNVEKKDDGSDNDKDEPIKTGTVVLDFDSSKGNVEASKLEGNVGDTITLTITPNENYEIDYVKANSIELTNSNYSFSLIEGKNNVEVSFKEKEKETFNIINDSSAYATLSGLPSEAKEGEEISFTFTLNVSYYTFSGSISVFTYGLNFAEEEVNVSNVNDTYTFLMPAKETHIRINVETNSYSLTFDNSNLISYVKKQEVGDEYASTISSGAKIKYGSEITVGLRSYSDDRLSISSGFKVIYSNGETKIFTKIDGKSEYTFSMPEYDIEIIETSSPYERTIEFSNSTNLTLSLYRKEDDKYVETKTGIKGETLYLKVNGETSSITTKEITMNYVKYSYSSSSDTEISETIYNSKNTDSLNSEGYFEFTMPDVQHGYNLNIQIKEKDTSKFLGYSFVGNYKGISLYNSNALGTVTKFKELDDLTIDSSGLMIKGTNSNNSEYQISSATSSFATLSESGKGFAYTSNTIYSSSSDFSMSNEGKTGTSSDFYFKIQDGTNEDDYSVYGELFVYNSTYYQVVTVYYNDTLYSSCVVDSSSTYTFDIEIEFLNGTHITDDEASYYIKKDNSILYYVGLNDDGVGRENRVILEKHGKLTLTSILDSNNTLYLNGLSYCYFENEEKSYTYVFSNDDKTLTLTKNNWTIILSIDLDNLTYTRTTGTEKGEYSGNDGTLTLDGLGNATLNSESYTYEFDATNTIILKKDDTKTKFVLDLENLTYTKSSLPKFAGYSYRGTYYDTWDEANEYIYVEFSDTDFTCGLKGGYSSTLNLNSSSYTFFVGETDDSGHHYTGYDTYSYNFETNILSFTMHSQSNDEKSMTMTYDSDNDTLTINENYQSTIYTTKGAILYKI